MKFLIIPLILSFLDEIDLSILQSYVVSKRTNFHHIDWPLTAMFCLKLNKISLHKLKQTVTFKPMSGHLMGFNEAQEDFRKH